MNTKRIVLLVLATALLAAAISAFISGLVPRNADSNSHSQTQIIERLERLESNLAKERDARLALQMLFNPDASMAESNKQFDNAVVTDNPGQDVETESLALDAFRDLAVQEIDLDNR